MTKFQVVGCILIVVPVLILVFVLPNIIKNDLLLQLSGSLTGIVIGTGIILLIFFRKSVVG